MRALQAKTFSGYSGLQQIELPKPHAYWSSRGLHKPLKSQRRTYFARTRPSTNTGAES
jgi:hypothetical protein